LPDSLSLCDQGSFEVGRNDLSAVIPLVKEAIQLFYEPGSFPALCRIALNGSFFNKPMLQQYVLNAYFR